MEDYAPLIRTADSKGVYGRARSSVYVYEAPVRLWHWANALVIVFLCVSGYLIASPLPSIGGEASDHYVMGYVRFVHFTCGQLLAVLFLARFVWAFWGNEHSRQLYYIPFWRWRYWYEAAYELAWYLFIVKHPKKYVGHNPLANLAMVVLFTALTIFMICTGFALYSEGQGIDSWQARAFGWVFAIWPNSQMVHTWHHFGLWGMVIFVLLHVYAAIREDIASRQTMISAITTGHRFFRDDDE